MSNYTTNTELLPNVYWVGAIDWTIRIFHGYHTDEGSSYNAYFISDKIPTLIDCVKETFWEEYLERISAIIPLDQIQQIIINHAEGDHTGSLPLVMPYLPNATIITNKVCKDHLCILYPVLSQYTWKIVNNTTAISTGTRTLNFLLVPNLHWPDSMFTLDGANNILFSNDCFGQHIASTDRWADQVQDLDHLLYFAKEYIANIFGPFRSQIRKAMKGISQYKIKYFLTAHGCSWRNSQTKLIFDEYYSYSHRKNLKEKLIIVFDSIYGETEKAAKTISEGASENKVQIQLCDLRVTDLTKIAYHAYEASGIAVGSPTINSRLTTKMEAALRYLRGLQLLGGKVSCIFGAYGWASKSLEMMELYLEGSNATVLQKLDFKYSLNSTYRNDMYQMGCNIANKIKEQYNVLESNVVQESSESSCVEEST